MPDSRLERLNVLILSVVVTLLLVAYFEYGALFVYKEWSWLNHQRYIS